MFSRVFSCFLPVFSPCFLIGCDGGTNATSGVVPELTRTIYDATTAGRLDEAIEAQSKLLPLFDVMLNSADFPEGFRAAIETVGFRMGPSRQPLSDEHKARLNQARTTLRTLLANVGTTDEPTGHAPSVDEHQIARIVESVVVTLQQRGMLSSVPS